MHGHMGMKLFIQSCPRMSDQEGYKNGPAPTSIVMGNRVVWILQRRRPPTMQKH